MQNLGKLYEVVSDGWFIKDPVRISWFVRLLGAMDENGTMEMSRQQLADVMGCKDRDTARNFLRMLENKNLVLLKMYPKSTQITLCNISDYKSNLPKLYPNEEEQGQNIPKIYPKSTQTSNSVSSDYKSNLPKKYPKSTQTDEISRKEERKENVLSPIPPIIKEKKKEKNPLTWGYDTDQVGAVSEQGTVPVETEKTLMRKAKTETRKQKELSLVSKAREVFEKYYSELYENSYYWEAKDAVAMKRLLQKISFARSNRKVPLPCDDDSLIDALNMFLRMIRKEWLMNNFSVNKIDGQYNEIVSEIKNKNKKQDGKNTTSMQGGSAEIAHQAAGILNDIARADELYFRNQQ